MRQKRGFTLIEVMVVLSILALIAVLAYSFFGSSMREAKLSQAATKMYNDFRVINDAVERYEMETGSWPADVAALVSAGYLKAVPQPIDAGFQRGAPYTGEYNFSATYDNMNAGTVSDAAIVAYYFTDEFCSYLIAKYASAEGTLQSDQWDYEANGSLYPGAVLGKGAQFYGIRWASADVDYCEVEWVVRYND